ncbi:MAG TPA: AtpZ/AtpI family protein [Terriglobia bacterium]|nr:AtpZ/AtpI family protein [Terriglobia bacterium]
MAGKTSDLWARAAFYATLGSIIPASGVAGYFFGWLLDHHLRTGSVLSVLGIFAGTGVGIYEVVQLIQRTEKNAGDRRNNRPD